MLFGGKFVVFLQVCCNILAKNIALLVQKIFGELFFCQNLFSAILRIKVSMATKLEGGGGLWP